MSKAQYVIGQRWISEAEAELGLGIVLDVVSRRLTLSFPAAAERRTYAIENAPVSRVVYEAGEKVRHQDGTSIKITRVLEQHGCLLYFGITEENEELSIPEFELDSFVQFSTPRDRLFAGQIDKHKHFTLRYQTLKYLNLHRQSPIFGLAGPRVQLLPHQLYIANEVAQRHEPRVLLADEVGLGKTIEAGLILHQQLISGRVKRALIVVPTSLQHQWLVEMLRRFNLAFTLLDENRCQALMGLDGVEEPASYVNDYSMDAEGGSDNPFETAQLILCSLDFITQNPERYTQALNAEWDLLLVDEAHHLQWSEKSASIAYQNRVGLEYLFPDYPNGIFAHWFTGEIRCPRGDRLHYVHGGYASIYEEDLFLEFHEGILKGSRVVKNEAPTPIAQEDLPWFLRSGGKND